jgi:hypothetical protein
MSDRKVAILKKVSLDEFADGWNGTYINVAVASYKEFKEYTQSSVENLTEEQGIDMITKLVHDKFVSGKIMILDDNNEPVLADAEIGDLDNLGVDMLNKLFTSIMGVSYDPKATQTEVPSKQPSLNSANATAE